jgi:ribosomal protein S18 acetylase RimI-like enzyme
MPLFERRPRGTPKTMDDCLIEQLDRTHIRDQFECGKPSLDDFIRTLVSQYEKRNLGRTYVAVGATERRVLGYYTIASSAITFDVVPAKSARKLPRHPVPVVLVARLAVDRSAQGQRLGEKLLLDALARSADLSGKLGIHAVVVDAIDQEAKAFYQKYQFITLSDNEFHLYLPISTIRNALGKS